MSIESEDVPRLNWPEIDVRPINEFEFDGLASLAFVVEFPLGQCDPTSKIRNYKVTEKQAVAHLIKYTEKHPVTGDLYYPFLKDPRLMFWLNDRIRRHAALNQTDVFLRLNQDVGILTIEQMKEMVRVGDQSLLQRLSPFVANIVGTQAYWYSFSRDQ